jgi:uncharacterized damage-inducible protein DinB
MSNYFNRLYKYNTWANGRLISLIEQNPAVYSGEVEVALSHYLAAQEIWISRIQGRAAIVGGVWEKYTLERCREIDTQSTESWLSFLSSASEQDFFQKIAYKNTQGDYYETPVIDIMGHWVNHATYHRAQIARMLRQAGITPVNTDYITYCRLHSLDFSSLT